MMVGGVFDEGWDVKTIFNVLLVDARPYVLRANRACVRTTLFKDFLRPFHFEI